MRNLLEYSDWSSSKEKIGQNVIVGGEQGQILSFDSDNNVWMVKFSNGVKLVSSDEIEEIENSKGMPFGGVYKQISAPTLNI